METKRTYLTPQQVIIFGVAGGLAICLILIVLWIALSGALYPDGQGVVENNPDPDPIFTQQSIVDQPTQSPGDYSVPTKNIITPEPGEVQTYTVEYGDNLGYIAIQFDISVEMLKQANHILDEDILEVGQVLIIPLPVLGGQASGFLIIPDSELVYSPGNSDFDTISFIESQNGYLASHLEEVHGRMLSGAEIVQLVALENSVNPRILLAVLEYKSGWVMNSPASIAYTPIVFDQPEDWRRGLFAQLSWAADKLNLGYYLWRVNGVDAWTLKDRVQIPINSQINAGTAAVHKMAGLLYPEDKWRAAVSEFGIYQTYVQLFGNPSDFAIETLLPDTLVQPEFRLPFEDGVRWTFTGGPHGGWGAGSAWAGLDFAPFDDPLGCIQSEAWVVAMADGWIVRSENGAVVQDLDDDLNEHTGWSILYMHIETRDRVENGAFVHAGDKIGHPSCEGGFSTGSHVHLARRYNGEWIPADQDILFVMDGWVSGGYGYPYDGYLEKNGMIIEACECQEIENTIIR